VRAFRTLIDTWAFKDPKPWDFFNTVERVSERDLDWFWRAWYYETWTLDQSIASVTTTAGVTTIEIADLGWVPMPARITVTTATGETSIHEIPVEAWLDGSSRAEVQVTGPEVVKVEIDAAGLFPDIDRSNNVWEKERG
jgi:aminopeptidase N